MVAKNLSYVDMPCDRCGSKRQESKPKNEKLLTTFGSSQLEVSVITCTNASCQEVFEKQREKDLIAINNRKLERENRNKDRQIETAKVLELKNSFNKKNKII